MPVKAILRTTVRLEAVLSRTTAFAGGGEEGALAAVVEGALAAAAAEGVLAAAVEGALAAAAAAEGVLAAAVVEGALAAAAVLSSTSNCSALGSQYSIVLYEAYKDWCAQTSAVSMMSFATTFETSSEGMVGGNG
ncbi:hypothetical protein K466DRAFT_570865, partial [Polyporus arcularius HHB13444]